MSAGVKTAMADQETKQPQIVSAATERNPERAPRDRGPRDRGRRRHGNQAPRHLEQSVNMNELRELVGLITENGLTLLELEREGFRVKIGRGPFYDETAAGAAQKQLAPASPPASGAVQSIPTTVPSHPGAGAEEAAIGEATRQYKKTPGTHAVFPAFRLLYGVV